MVGASSSETASAETYPIKVKQVRFGLPPGPFVKELDENGKATNLFKGGAWAPIQIWLDTDLAAPLADQEIEIIVGTPDGDDVISEASLRFPAPVVGKQEGIRVPRDFFLKTGSISTTVSVRIVGAASRQPLAAPFQQQILGLPPSRYLLLSAGSSLAGLRLPKVEGQAGEVAPEAEPLRNGWLQLAVAKADELPDRWFGYDAVDLLILNAADSAFWDELAKDKERCRAIADWVRRGGRLLISGAAALHSHHIFDGDNPIPFPIDRDAGTAVNELAIVLPNSSRLVMKAANRNPIPLVALKTNPDLPYQAKLFPDERDATNPLVAQASYGLGRITLVAFDLDRPPFDQWQHRHIFWDWLLNLAASRLPNGSEIPTTDASNPDEDKYLARLQNNLDFFEGVPAVSFSWVALLILLYIVLIGPIEYLILTRLLKRLEFTWLTFPIIVISMCAIAYFAALDLKGRDLRINKIDLVEIDLRGKHVYGETWLTIFSPRIQEFDIAVEPAWVAAQPENTLVSWFGKAKSTRQSLLRRTYSYRTSGDEYADGIERAPIQVWSTKSFDARWEAPLTEPLIESTLRMSEADPNQITGSITSRLPLEVLVDAQLIYRGRSVPVPPLLRGVPRYLSTSNQDAVATTWLQNAILQKDLIPLSQAARSGRGEFEDDPRFTLWPVLFHDLVQGQFGRLWNASERELDQSWRVGDKNPNEAILIVRLGRTIGPAEEMSSAPASATRLWLGRFPGSGPRPPLEGVMRRETFIRVYIPIHR